MLRIIFLNRFLLILILSVIFGHGSVYSQSVSEYGVKAGFIFNFAKFAELKSELKTLNICVYQDINVLNEFLPLAERKVQDVELRVVLVSELKALVNCDILFIPRSTSLETEKNILSKAEENRILTIGESETFLGNGGIISFFVQDNKIRFSISKSALENSSIGLSSKLLRIANVI